MLKIDRLSEERLGEKAGREEGEKRKEEEKINQQIIFRVVVLSTKKYFFSPTMMISNDAELSSWDPVPTTSRQYTILSSLLAKLRLFHTSL
jgi:hypothetical protein